MFKWFKRKRKSYNSWDIVRSFIQETMYQQLKRDAFKDELQERWDKYNKPLEKTKP